MAILLRNPKSPADISRTLDVRLSRIERPPRPQVVPVSGSQFRNTWVNFGSTAMVASYWDTGFETVLFGAIKSGVMGQPAIALPPNLIPFNSFGVLQTFSVISNSAVGAVQVDGNGFVIPIVGSNLSVWLNGIRFLHV